jgi:serine/threonine-protein kinase HipA
MAARELGIWLHADRVGTLSLDADKLGFAYDARWLSHVRPRSLSCSLPLRDQPFGDRECRPFFSGLLPEGQLRQLIAQQCQVSGRNDFALLAAIGGECAGAITFLPVGDEPKPAVPADIAWLDAAQLRDLLDELPQRPMLAGRDGLRLSLAGAQDKLPVVFDGRRIGLPKGGQPSTHILKPAIRTLEGSVINEAFCLALADTMHLPAAQAVVHAIDDRQVLLVSRYDRRIADDGLPSRLHQEDFCQALRVVPELKYQNEGGPGLAACFALVRSVTRPSAPQVLRLLDYVVFNALVGNHDAHAKNFSLLYSATIPQLAPMYDVLCTAIYPGLASKMAMKVGSKYQFDDLQARHWDQFADEAGLSRSQMRKRMVRFAAALPTAAQQLCADQHFAGQALIEKIVALIDERCALVTRRLQS